MRTYNPNLASLLIRIGLASVFVYAAISALKTPDAWVSYVPSFSSHFIAAKTALDMLSVFQLFLALWLVSGYYLKLAALVAAGMLAGIMVFNLGTLLITFRDFGLVFGALALIALDPPPTKKSKKS